MNFRTAMKAVFAVVAVSGLYGCGPVDVADEGEAELSAAESGLTCAPFYTEDFNDWAANAMTTGPKVSWCGTSIKSATASPLCMASNTLGTNSSTVTPAMWINKGTKSCTGVKVQYGFYQYASAGVTLEYQQSSDTAAVCPKTGTFFSAASHVETQVCVAKTVVIPFGSASGVYVRFKHSTSNSNAIWIDNVKLSLDGCTSC